MFAQMKQRCVQSIKLHDVNCSQILEVLKTNLMPKYLAVTYLLLYIRWWLPVHAASNARHHRHFEPGWLNSFFSYRDVQSAMMRNKNTLLPRQLVVDRRDLTACVFCIKLRPIRATVVHEKTFGEVKASRLSRFRKETFRIHTMFCFRWPI